jgi:hypothetical protein
MADVFVPHRCTIDGSNLVERARSKGGRCSCPLICPQCGNHFHEYGVDGLMLTGKPLDESKE